MWHVRIIRDLFRNLEDQMPKLNNALTKFKNLRDLKNVTSKIKHISTF